MYIYILGLSCNMPTHSLTKSYKTKNNKLILTLCMLKTWKSAVFYLWELKRRWMYRIFIPALDSKIWRNSSNYLRNLVQIIIFRWDWIYLGFLSDGISIYLSIYLFIYSSFIRNIDRQACFFLCPQSLKIKFKECIPSIDDLI